MCPIPFSVFNWANVEKIENKGETGTSLIQTLQFDNLTIRMVQYSANYIADRWCRKGHVVYCLEGEIFCVLLNSDGFILTKNISFVVSNEMSSHRIVSINGAKLLIIDGDF